MSRLVPRASRKSLWSSGQVLLGVLILALIITGSSVSFIWFMNQQQSRAGGRYRSLVALHVAEAGVHRAVGVLEYGTLDGRISGRDWRPTRYTETVQVGPWEATFTLSVDEEPDGTRIVTSLGEVAGVSRRIRARVRLTSPVLLAALAGPGYIKLDGPPSATFILPYGTGAAILPWVHLMAGRAVWFSSSDVLINSSRVTLTTAPGPADAATARAGGWDSAAAIRVRLARDAILSAGGPEHPVDASQLRAFGMPIQDVVAGSLSLPAFPEVDREALHALAAANRQNVAINSTAGRYAGDGALERKAGSDYTGAEFVRVLSYLAAERKPSPLRGVIYVHGTVMIPAGVHVEIAEGALITESTVHIGWAAGLTISHSAATRTLPGLVALDQGRLIVAPRGSLRAHGLVYANRAIEVGEGATFDVVGAVLGNDPGMSFRTSATLTVIRYDPAVLGTQGLLTPIIGPLVAWISSWEEVP